MDTRFQANNLHLLEGVEHFLQYDPHLKRLRDGTYIYHADLIDTLPKKETGIYTLSGARQIGKTSLLKQWMATLLQQQVAPASICFYSGELITDYQSLYSLLKNQLDSMPKDSMRYMILDEVTDIDQWDKTVKYLADTGELEQVIFILTGSDLALMQDARKRFPGRRGKASTVDFHYYPLSFKETVALKGISTHDITQLYQAFHAYLIHGGFLTAINDFAANQSIAKATLATYSDWIRGDMLKRNKKELYLQEITGGIIKHYSKQISWTNLAKELSIDHVQTVADYLSLLSSMDAVFVQSALIENTLKAAPKKQKKVMFCDPFIFHAMRDWLNPCDDPYQQQILPLLEDPIAQANLVESCVTTQYRRFFPTYYIKAAGEVDIAYIHQNRFWPIEIKWTYQLRSNDLKQVSKYNNARILAKVQQATQINNIPVEPLPLALLTVGMP